MATQLRQRLQGGVETAGEFVFQGEKGEKAKQRFQSQTVPSCILILEIDKHSNIC